MANIARVTRRKSGPIEVWVPYMGHSNKSLVQSLLPDAAHAIGRQGNVWLVPRTHLTALVQGLASQPTILDVELNLYQAGVGGCVSACYTGSDSELAMLTCQCSCVGLNHATGHPPEGSRFVGTSHLVGDVYRFPGNMRTVMYSELWDEMRKR